MYSISQSQYTFKDKRNPALKDSICRGLQFKAVDTDLKQLFDYINNGHAYTHVFIDDRRKKDNFKCTSIISIDIDDCPVDIDNALNQVDMKPTFCHYTASNGVKGDGFRYRFIYVFDDIIYRESYSPLVSAITQYLENSIEGYRNSDNCSLTLNQFYFGSDPSEVRLINNDITYRISDFIDKGKIESERHEEKCKVLRHAIENVRKEIQIPETGFFEDLRNMKPIDFLEKYHEDYCIIECSEPIDHKYGALIYDKENYMEMISVFERYVDDDGKKHIRLKRYVDGEGRRNKLCADAVMLRKIKPGISLEELVYNLIHLVYRLKKYDNSDKALDVLGIAKNIMNRPQESIDSFEYKGRRKAFMVDKAYCMKNGVKPRSYVKVVTKQLRKEIVMPVYEKYKDLSHKAIVAKVKEETGVEITEKTLRSYVREDDMDCDCSSSFLEEENKNKLLNSSPTINPQFPISEKPAKRKGSITDDELDRIYDRSISLKSNLTIMKDSDMKIGKDRLYQYCHKRGIKTKGEK